MRLAPTRRRSRWLAAAALLSGALLAPATGTVTSFAATTPDETTPAVTTPAPADAPTTPVATTPVAPDLSGAATAAQVSWTAPPSLTEETRFSLTAAGAINGQATGHIALLAGVAVCPASPLFPRQVSTGTRITVAADPPPTTPAAPGAPAALGGSFSQTLTLTARDSGVFHLCGWVVGTPPSSEASTVSLLDQVVNIGNRPSSLAVDAPATARAGDYFSVKLTGTTPASGRRALIMADPDKGQDCAAMRKAASGKRPLQSVVGLPTGDFSKTLRLRFRSKTAGKYLVCVQVVEINDRAPEAAAARSVDVTEGIKCVASQTALTQRSTDLTTVRKRRDAAQVRLAAAKKKLAPARTKASKQRRISQRRISAARKAVTKAKSKAGKAKARKRLARVRKTETARMYRAAAPLRTANALVRQQERAYRQYRTGANLLTETITRTRKDLKKYCASV